MSLMRTVTRGGCGFVLHCNQIHFCDAGINLGIHLSTSQAKAAHQCKNSAASIELALFRVCTASQRVKFGYSFSKTEKKKFI